MEYKVIAAESFERDIEAAAEYISDRLFNPMASNRLIEKVVDTISRIKKSPLMYPIYRDKNIIYAVIGNFLLFYQVNETAKTIYIMRLLYGKMNLSDILE